MMVQTATKTIKMQDSVLHNKQGNLMRVFLVTLLSLCLLLGNMYLFLKNSENVVDLESLDSRSILVKDSQNGVPLVLVALTPLLMETENIVDIAYIPLQESFRETKKIEYLALQSNLKQVAYASTSDTTNHFVSVTKSGSQLLIRRGFQAQIIGGDAKSFWGLTYVQPVTLTVVNERELLLSNEQCTLLINVTVGTFNKSIPEENLLLFQLHEQQLETMVKISCQNE